MNHEQFPRASASFIKANPQLFDSEPQRASREALERPIEAQETSDPRIIVSIKGYRCRPLDPDNFAGGCKSLIDALRAARLIPGDNPFQIKLETSQDKVSHHIQERIEVTIIYQWTTNEEDSST